MQRTLTAVLLLMVVLGCVTNRTALNASKTSASWITEVKLGQTQNEVRAIMRKGPESTAARALPDGTNEEVWNYLTDYDNDTNTSITFRNGKVVELAQTKWLGNGKFDEPLNAARPTTSEQAVRIETLDTIVRSGMSRDAMFKLVGPPTKSTIRVDSRDWRARSRGDSTETATYVSAAGTTFVVILENNIVSSVTRKAK